MGGQKEVATETFDVEGTDVDSVIGSDFHAQLRDDIELLDGASDEFDQELVSAGNSPRYSSDPHSQTSVSRHSWSIS